MRSRRLSSSRLGPKSASLSACPSGYPQRLLSALMAATPVIGPSMFAGHAVATARRCCRERRRGTKCATDGFLVGIRQACYVPPRHSVGSPDRDENAVVVDGFVRQTNEDPCLTGHDHRTSPRIMSRLLKEPSRPPQPPAPDTVTGRADHLKGSTRLMKRFPPTTRMDRRCRANGSSSSPEATAAGTRTTGADHLNAPYRSPEAIRVIGESVFADHCDRSRGSQNEKNFRDPASGL